MEQRRNIHQPAPPRPNGQAGFSLIEIVVVIVVMGVISAMVTVNWNSFMRHQELRQDAINLHKEIMALKALAIEHGDTVTLRTSSVGDNTYIIRCQIPAPTATNDSATTPFTKSVKLNNGVKIDTGFSDISDWGALKTNGWHSTNGPAGTIGTVKILVRPDNIKAYDSVYIAGRVVLSSDKVKARYCIQKDSANIKPELYHQSNKDKPWTKM